MFDCLLIATTATMMIGVAVAQQQLSSAQAVALDAVLQALGCNRNSSACPPIAQLQSNCAATAGTVLRLQCSGGMVEHLSAPGISVLAGGSISSHIGQLSALTHLNAVRNGLTLVHTMIGRLTRLRDLALYENLIDHLPDEIGDLTALTYLSVRSNILVGTTPNMARLTLLETLALSDNPELASLPVGLSRLTALTYLSFRDTSVDGAFPDLTRLSSLREVHFFNTSLAGVVRLPNTATLEECRLGGTCLTCTASLPPICECSQRATCVFNPTPPPVTGAPGSGVPGSGVPGSGVPGSAATASVATSASSSLSSSTTTASTTATKLETSLRVVFASSTLSPDDNTPVIAGAVGGAILACVLLALVVFIACRARKSPSERLEPIDSEVTAYSSAPETIDIAPVARYGHSPPATNDIARVERYGQLSLKRDSNNTYGDGRLNT